MLQAEHEIGGAFTGVAAENAAYFTGVGTQLLRRTVCTVSQDVGGEYFPYIGGMLQSAWGTLRQGAAFASKADPGMRHARRRALRPTAEERRQARQTIGCATLRLAQCAAIAAAVGVEMPGDESLEANELFTQAARNFPVGGAQRLEVITQAMVHAAAEGRRIRQCAWLARGAINLLLGEFRYAGTDRSHLYHMFFGGIVDSIDSQERMDASILASANTNIARYDRWWKEAKQVLPARNATL